jgi:hypothetical protein
LGKVRYVSHGFVNLHTSHSVLGAKNHGMS